MIHTNTIADEKECYSIIYKSCFFNFKLMKHGEIVHFFKKDKDSTSTQSDFFEKYKKYKKYKKIFFMVAVGFEPTPSRFFALNWRLGPLGQTFFCPSQLTWGRRKNFFVSRKKKKNFNFFFFMINQKFLLYIFIFFFFFIKLIFQIDNFFFKSNSFHSFDFHFFFLLINKNQRSDKNEESCK
ncbi:hypothetical protein TRFO_33848 [Tritrichomonas foetus]|uniref:Uncharacterized protein n=1 Tax=Tritrichomonas foetus TaxID=1144522 RepID=A0A1J4JQB4_9EUKA|nr:hypothetical protein TRFO_33848 [Tritrichomonas foetus]|eukprot:OHS99717.1 hypothetical protein TRFO_33848 [Tritrichomonas foetus]